MVSMLSSAYFHLRRIPKKFILQVAFIALVIFIFCLFVIPVRHAVFTSTFRKEWYDFGTFDILAMKITPSGQSGVTERHTCATRAKAPAFNADEVQAGMMKNPTLKSEVFPLPEADHGFFLPVLSVKIKLEFLRMYLLVSKVFEDAGVQYFIRAGTLLGVHRHHGFIPWDDDMDLAVNVSDWMKVKKGLSCLDGYVLKVNPHAVWRFYPNSSEIPDFPIIDFFFYTENSEYVFNMPHFAYLKKDVFPLVRGEFEGLSVPIPRNTEHLLRSQYDYEVCLKGESNHRQKKRLKEPVIVNCSDLSYLYTMYHLRS